MIQGLVLSHTKMGETGFCSVFGYRSHGNILQARPRWNGNQPLLYRYFGANAEPLKSTLRPGAMVSFDGYRFVEHARRRTHPEDFCIASKACELAVTSRERNLNELRNWGLEIAEDSIHDLFPELISLEGTQKLFCDAKTVNLASVGYIRANRISFFEEFGKLAARVIDHAGNSFDAKVIGIDELERQDELYYEGFRNVLVRCSLAGAYQHQNWIDSDYPSRCYLMVSHFYEL